MCPKSTLLFVTFAQYLTDGFIRTVPEKDPDTGSADEENRKRNTSNHEIDMCPLYGRNVEQTNALRVQSPSASDRGRLRSQYIDGEEFPPFLFDNGVIDPGVIIPLLRITLSLSGTCCLRSVEIESTRYHRSP